ncbi:hypothetical protein [Actinoplanes sp. NPDC051411]|uniref:hypothetical protein n=1 Tax=Actinoplanes sp. NPDC051411 TaxID=3155522 RepID=UPI00341A8364
MIAVLVVGPRELPDDGFVRVWIDSGSTAGAEIPVPAANLTLADEDDGRGSAAVYALHARQCWR